MLATQTPFGSGWWGTELGDVRPRVGTYGRYPREKLPTLPFELRGDFAWLIRQPKQRSHIGKEKSIENDESLKTLLDDAARKKLMLPGEFVAFFRSRDLQQRVRSCTDCFLDLSAVCVPSPLGDGFLVRFLADSQGCVFWYLYQRPGDADHCVVASSDFYGDDAEQWQDTPPNPSQIVFCEESFEAFVCRFFLENEIWFSGYEKKPLSAEGKEYLQRYGK